MNLFGCLGKKFYRRFLKYLRARVRKDLDHRIICYCILFLTVITLSSGSAMQNEFLITKSTYYNQLFNTAIFFDPFRIYFNHSMESSALELYYYIQKHFGSKYDGAHRNYYILIYPDVGHFKKSFGETEQSVLVVHEPHDLIIGIAEPKILSTPQLIIEAIEGASNKNFSVI